MDLFEKIRELNEDIKYIYQKLNNLECNGYKNAPLYEKYVNNLKYKIQLENDLFLKLTGSFEYEQYKEEILTYDGKEDFYLRMRDRIILHDITTMDDEFSDYTLMEEEKNIYSLGKIFDSSSLNLFMLYICFLDSTISKLIVKSLRDRLIKIKYYNCYVKHNLEKFLIGCDFVLPSEIYTYFKLSVDLMGLDEKVSLDAILDSYMTTINNALKNLMNYTDDEYSNDEGLLAISINYQCLLKAVFALMYESEYRMLENEIIDKIREFASKDNVGMIENILEIINNRNEYRSKVKKLSLRPYK